MPCEDAAMDDHDALVQLRADIFDAFPPGPQRDAWLAWFSQLATDSIWCDEAYCRTLQRAGAGPFILAALSSRIFGCPSLRVTQRIVWQPDVLRF
jgi:hypothetical protein